MKIFTIKRSHSIAGHGVFGVLDCDGFPFALTCENFKLHIPKGEYLCKKAFYYKGNYATYEITGVPNRDHILFHCGNTEEDSAGCVLVAEEFGELHQRIGVLRSKYGFAEFMARANNEESFKLIIEEV